MGYIILQLIKQIITELLNWCNNKFKKLYVNKTMSVYVNLQSNSYIKNNEIVTAIKRKRI